MTSQDLMQTDADWEHLAQTDAYWAVLTHDRFHRTTFGLKERAEFFASGAAEVEKVFHIVRTYLDPAFAPKRVLDFGCGVGRILIPLARRCAEAVGVDVSETMLREAATNCREAGVGNVTLVRGDDALSGVSGSFDLVNTLIVLQHIPVERGLGIFRRLVELVAPGGCGALHVNYAVPAPPPAPAPGRGLLRSVARTVLAPLRRRPGPGVREMQMNPYPINPLLRAIQSAGVRWVHVEVSEGDEHCGAQFFFRRSQVPAAAA